VAAFFHCLFKLLAILVYIFTESFILSFILCVILHALDFWTVKNVSGRLLVGLRWWNAVKEDGSSEWVFESKPESRQVHPQDSFIFWTALYITPVVWVFLAIGEVFLFKVQWLLLVAVALVLNCANVVGYWKCQRDQGQRLSRFIAQRMVQ